MAYLCCKDNFREWKIRPENPSVRNAINIVVDKKKRFFALTTKRWTCTLPLAAKNLILFFFLNSKLKQHKNRGSFIHMFQSSFPSFMPGKMVQERPWAWLGV